MHELEQILSVLVQGRRKHGAHTNWAEKNKQGKLEHIEDNGFIFKKLN